MKVPLAGGSPTTLASGQSVACFVAVDATSVYWAGAGNVMKVPLAGGTPTTLASGQSPSAIAIDATNIYWTNAGRDAGVMKVALGGGTPTALFSMRQEGGTLLGMSLGGDIAVDTTSVYWTDDVFLIDSCHHGTVRKVPLAGGAPTTLASGQNTPAAIAVDATNVYWVNSGDSYADTGTVMRLPLAGGAPTTLAAAQGYPSNIALAGGTVYWTTAPLRKSGSSVPDPHNTVMRLGSCKDSTCG